MSIKDYPNSDCIILSLEYPLEFRKLEKLNLLEKCTEIHALFEEDKTISNNFKDRILEISISEYYVTIVLSWFDESINTEFPFEFIESIRSILLLELKSISNNKLLFKIPDNIDEYMELQK